MATLNIKYGQKPNIPDLYSYKTGESLLVQSVRTVDVLWFYPIEYHRGTLQINSKIVFPFKKTQFSLHYYYSALRYCHFRCPQQEFGYYLNLVCILQPSRCRNRQRLPLNQPSWWYPSIYFQSSTSIPRSERLSQYPPAAWAWELTVDVWPADRPGCAKGLCCIGTRCETSRFHLCWQSFPSGDCRWINKRQNDTSWRGLLWQKHAQIYHFFVDQFSTCTSNGSGGRDWCVCVSVCAEGGHLYHLGCRSKKMEELHYGEICTNMLGNSVCLWSLIEIWICYRMPPVTVTFDSSIHELVHRCGWDTLCHTVRHFVPLLVTGELWERLFLWIRENVFHVRRPITWEPQGRGHCGH